MKRYAFNLLFIAQVTQYVGCLIFTMIDAHTRRDIPYNDAIIKSFVSGAGCLAMYYLLTSDYEWMRGDNIIAPTPSMFECVGQAVVCTLLSDFMHYWSHRLLHYSTFLRNKVHSTHHSHSGPLYSWVGMDVNPIEAVIVNTCIYLPFVMFAHPYVGYTFALLATINATVAHSGYSRGGLATFGMPCALTPKEHEMHHDVNSTKNFGNILNIWDKWCGTYTNRGRQTAQL